MTEDVAQIEADGSDSDTCHSERGEEIGPAKWGQTGSQTCSTLVSVFKSPCAATLLLRSNQEGEGGEAGGGMLCSLLGDGKMGAVLVLLLPVSWAWLCPRNELTGLTEVHCA